MPKLNHIQKVLVIGSGPIVIGQAAEFDYAGTQACLALKEEGIEVVLVNNNPATIMTDPYIADRVYVEPLTCASITEIIKKERPDGLLPTLGGQTGLNMAVSLTNAGVLQEYKVELLGTPLDTIQKGEDRESFKALMKEIGEPVPESLSTSSLEEALEFAASIGYPLIIRPAYTLGGAGGGIADNEEQFISIVKGGLHASPITQVLIEQSVKGWKEIEYEVMRDSNDTCIIVCNMENIDAVGIHTGDSIVVAPSQTLNDRQYQMLRTVSCKVIRELGVIGGCNIQLALNPDSDEYVIIEVNPRVSRSSALASKATGYPIARIAAKIALGYHLDEILNPITGDTYASFEPSIDYLAVKIPRWPFDKFTDADRKLGTQMKATGEVMALARNFPAALNKAIRSLDMELEHLEASFTKQLTKEELEQGLVEATDERIFILAEALRRGYSVDAIHALTAINKFFLYEISFMIQFEQKLKDTHWQQMDLSLLKQAKNLGFTNSIIAQLCEVTQKDVQEKLDLYKVQPSYKMVDTCAAEFSADTPYYYGSWNEFDEVEDLQKEKRILVLGSGPIRIGQGVEFDYCSVQAAASLRDQGIGSIVVNNNPETVSTDYNTADHLYFEPLSIEDVLHIIEREKAEGVLVQFGGQTAINLAEKLHHAGIKVLGTSLESIDKTEDREKFYHMLQKLEIPHIPGATVTSFKDAQKVAQSIGYPILLRPSYVIGGKGMVIIQSEEELLSYLEKVEKTSTDQLFPLLIDRFVKGYEAEIDVVCNGEDILIPGIFEHVEKAGIHSGDSMAIFPSAHLTESHKQIMTEYARKISAELKAKGMMNIQFVLSEDRNEVYVLEVNPRASRTVPIATKVTGVPLIDLATRIQTGESLKDMEWSLGLHEAVSHVAIKIPVFSTNKLPGVDPFLGPEMKSTGEAIGIGSTIEAAMVKAFGWKEKSLLPLGKEEMILVSFSEEDLLEIEGLGKTLQTVKARVVATPLTARTLQKNGIMVQEISEKDAVNLILDKQCAVVCSTSNETRLDGNIREAAAKMDTICFTSKETLGFYLQASTGSYESPLAIHEYVSKTLNKKERVLK
ncbi:carbamoyl-phosphate synthase (glutamine-hydrolyzing) large subunit [Radiobacillus kanasensis]|uniref:carbamoyl-phosphate synthase (glutamine-hydrolyzing) large subunit n=1 Tax=Radiobacillus kanasensis TaxID=2844358 RepID=UPI001E658521|nr:carbamoyl-phosphate synthase (glutamine-hydrolyzing) large subunit [Radiobacillus kanasensis]UFT99747.1 carbamoyl-phosphate synthase (glutamine-hydrolyzing) large subunit [Radiobacillus kanasensis]